MIWTWAPCDSEPVTFVMREYLIAPPSWYTRCYFDPEEICVSEALYQAPGLVVQQETAFTWLADSGIDPPAGGCVLIDVQARDEAGNVSMGECP